MASDTKNVKLGVCSVSYNGVDLGYTKGGVEVAVTTETKKVMVDQFGQTVINEIVMSRNCTVKVPLAETTLENLVLIMPGAALSGTGVGAASTKKVDVTTAVGVSLLDIAAPLVLHPLSKAANDKTEDFTIPKASTPGAISFSYQFDNERVFNCEFSAYPDPVTGKLFTVGVVAA